MYKFIKNIFLTFLFIIIFGQAGFAQKISSDSLIISSVRISGNKKTKDFVILRELTFRKNDKIPKEELPEHLKKSKTN